MRNRKIKVVVPVSETKWNKALEELLKSEALPATEIEVTSLESGPKSIESEFDEAYAEHHVVDEVVKAEREGFNAVVIYCFGNPGLYAAREAVDIPVIGIGEASQLLAMSLGRKFSIISPVPWAVKRHWDKAKVIGSIGKLASIRCVNIPVLDLDRDVKILKESILEKAEEAIKEDDADVVVLGCGSMMGIAQEISRELGIPVIDPGLAGFRFAEILVEMNLSHSKRAFMKPDFGKIVR